MKRVNITDELFIFELDYVSISAEIDNFHFWAKLTQKVCFQP